jgi:hypothetical protein
MSARHIRESWASACGLRAIWRNGRSRIALLECALNAIAECSVVLQRERSPAEAVV